ncbi:hypothetical protein HPB50_015360 [Hyalomma asiaticum]|uniref:Uncharacterized protein n=1 Tax=Hyalomma asiaticum TaxID=266040 RepID=A0ACB7RZ30_HYAAI|nr:hypothetical protein HPB50_015360 [Hyalomma asiaticum]
MSRVPESKRRDIVDLSLQGHSPLSTVNRIIQAYLTERRIKDAPRKARPQVTTEDEDMAIVAAAVDNPTASVEEIKKSTGLAHVSNTTVKRCVGNLARQFRSRSYMPEYMQRVAASGRSAVSVWGAVTAERLGPLVRIEGRFMADAYCGILDDVLLPYLVGKRLPTREEALELYFSLPDDPTSSDSDRDTDEDFAPELAPPDSDEQSSEAEAAESTRKPQKRKATYSRKKRKQKKVPRICDEAEVEEEESDTEPEPASSLPAASVSLSPPTSLTDISRGDQGRRYPLRNRQPPDRF